MDMKMEVDMDVPTQQYFGSISDLPKSLYIDFISRVSACFRQSSIVFRRSCFGVWCSVFGDRSSVLVYPGQQRGLGMSTYE